MDDNSDPASDNDLTVVIAADSHNGNASTAALRIDIPHPANGTQDNLSCLLHLPMQIDLPGALKYPVFEIRLGEMLAGFMAMDELQLTPQNYQILHGASLDTWHHALSSITLDEMKMLKAADEAPSSEQILATLPSIDGEWRPGTYTELILPGAGALAADDKKIFIYFGSGSGVGLGIAMRCEQHGSAAHRAHE